MGTKAELLRIELLLGEMVWRMQYGDRRALEGAAQILADAEGLKVRGLASEEVASVAANAAVLAALSRLQETNGQLDSNAQEYLDKADRYRRYIETHTADWTRNTQFLLSTLLVRLGRSDYEEDAQALKEMNVEVRRWEAIWRSRDPTPAVRVGLGTALWMRAERDWQGDSFEAADVIHDMVRAKQTLQPLSGLYASIGAALIFRVRFDLSQVYWENGQESMAMAELEGLLASTNEPGDMPAVRRAAAVERLATYQQAEAPESTASMMEEEIRQLRELLSEDAGTEGSSPSAFDDLVGGPLGLATEIRNLAETLASYRLLQAEKADEGPGRVRLVRKAGDAYRELLSATIVMEKNGVHTENSSRESTEKSIKACEGYHGGSVPGQPLAVKNPVE
jgi:hypothetical protein